MSAVWCFFPSSHQHHVAGGEVRVECGHQDAVKSCKKKKKKLESNLPQKIKSQKNKIIIYHKKIKS